MKFASCLPCALSILAFSSSAWSAEEVFFQLKFEPGKTYLIESKIEQKATMPMAGQQIETESTMTLVTSQQVSKHEEGLAVVQKSESLLVDMTVGGMALSYNSAKPQGPAAAMFAPMLEASSTLVLGEKGEVISVTAQVPVGLEAMGMGEAEVKQSAREMVDLMANKKVKEGGNWLVISSFPLGGIVEKPVPVVYTLVFEKMVDQDERRLAKVRVSGEVKPEPGPLTVTAKEMGGYFLFDPEIAQVREAVLTYDFEIGLPEGTPLAPGAAGKMPLKMKSHSVLSEIKP
ncbi:hypothetical protein [Roseibacillus ishigakijimensis]|uniref:Uncharacterized protein n=1 Tax=Roseibacillus ishigakijimensis TaxID=454146 RepID=A0A934RJC0_9BACT|nr:hypothetical protein [Roseibacillus ishigakijimensis]MBK1832717.1 hypothetical protein [Roseibacillus ishigakijimensis]